MRRSRRWLWHRPASWALTAITNQVGSGCSLGHPIACTGARMLVTMAHQLARTDTQWGVAAMCAAGGMGAATVIERL